MGDEMYKIERCPYCDCPYVGDINYEYLNWSIHYGNCPILKKAKDGHRYWKLKNINPRPLRDLFKEEMATHNDAINSYMKKIKTLQDEMTDACLDEVYLCRYDCINGRLATA